MNRADANRLISTMRCFNRCWTWIILRDYRLPSLLMFGCVPGYLEHEIFANLISSKTFQVRATGGGNRLSLYALCLHNQCHWTLKRITEKLRGEINSDRLKQQKYVCKALVQVRLLTWIAFGAKLLFTLAELWSFRLRKKVKMPLPKINSGNWNEISGEEECRWLD